MKFHRLKLANQSKKQVFFKGGTFSLNAHVFPILFLIPNESKGKKPSRKVDETRKHENIFWKVDVIAAIAQMLHVTGIF